MRRRSRPLSPDERALWAEVARSVQPLKGRAADPAARPTPSVGADVSSTTARAPATPVDAGQPLRAVGPLDRRTVSALRRGRHGIDAVIDLHGLRQAEAHQALRAFLRRAQHAGLRTVLIVTGKGAAGAPSIPFEERGVLRRVVPHWLRLPDVRPLVIGFEEAAAHHGGAGALYVRLRRARGPDASGG